MTVNKHLPFENVPRKHPMRHLVQPMPVSRGSPLTGNAAPRVTPITESNEFLSAAHKVLTAFRSLGTQPFRAVLTSPNVERSWTTIQETHIDIDKDTANKRNNVKGILLDEISTAARAHGCDNAQVTRLVLLPCLILTCL